MKSKTNLYKEKTINFLANKSMQIVNNVKKGEKQKEHLIREQPRANNPRGWILN